MIGERFDRFEKVRIIEDCGPLRLYSAVHTFRRLPVFLKIVEKPGNDPYGESACGAQKSLLLETIATDSVIHPNVIRVIDSGVGPGFETFLALERLEGGSLAQRLVRRGPMSVVDALKMATEVARALVAIHEQQIVHCDITPANIVLLANGNGVKLTGFGSAFTPGLEVLRPSYRPDATLAYMCPRYAATGVADERCDLFSLGVVLYEAIAGICFVHDEGRFQIAEHSFELLTSAPSAPMLLHELVPAVPPELSAEVHRTISRDPQDRPRNARELLQILEQQLSCSKSGSRRKPSNEDAPTVPYGIAAAVRAIDGAAQAREQIKMTCADSLSRFDPACGTPILLPADLLTSDDEAEGAGASATMRDQPTVPEVPAVRRPNARPISKGGGASVRDSKPADGGAPPGSATRRL